MARRRWWTSSLQPDQPAAPTRLDRRQYLRHFLIVFGGNGLAQLVNLLGYPLLARLYSPAEFGTFGMFVAAVMIPGVVACGRFEFAIPTAPRWGVSTVLWLCIWAAVAVGLISMAVAELAALIGLIHLSADLVLLFGLSIFLTGFCTGASMFLMRLEQYRTVSASVLVRTAGAVGAQIALALAWGGSVSLVAGFTFGLLVQAVMLASVLRSVLRRGPKRRALNAMFARFRRQVFVDFPSTLVSAVSNSILTFLLAILYDQRTVGFFAIGSRLAVVPLTIFNDALAQIFFQKAARAREQKGHLWEELKFSLIVSGVFSIGVLLALVLFARPFVRIFLGSEWMPAADMLVILAPMLAARGLAMSVATTVFVLQSAHWLLIHNVATVLLPLAAFAAAAVLHLGPIGFLAVAAILLTLEYVLFALFLASAARQGATAAAR